MTPGTFFLGFSTVLCILYALGELAVRKLTPRNWYLAGVFFFLSLFLMQSFLWSSGFISSYPHLLHIHMPGSVLIGPFLERYLILVWENTAESLNRFLVKCAVSLGIVSLNFQVYFFSENEKRIYIESVLQNGAPFRTKLSVFLTISILLYFLARLSLHFLKLFRLSTLKSSPTLRLILAIIVTWFLSALTAVYFIFKGSVYGMELNGYFIGAFIICIYLLRQRNPEIFLEVQKIVEEEKKYKTSQLKKIDLAGLNFKLKNLFEKEKIYRDDAISLSKLAVELDITNHQLSEYLNQEWKTSFFQLIHKYRIDEAKDLLIRNEKETILSIAYAVGYQSKSSFNEIFKKETGLTPTEFRKLKKKKKNSPNL